MNKITLPLLVSAPSFRDMMRTKVTSLLTTGLTLFVLAPTAFSQEDAGFTAVEKSAEGLQEAILMTASKLVQVYGGDAVGPGTLTFNGIFTDGSWQADFSGDYAGEPVALDFTGTYDDSKNAGAFTVTGTYGSATWDGDGSWRYDIVDPQTIDMFWDSAASIIDELGRLFEPDKHFTTPKKWARSRLPDGRWHVVDSGEYRTTYFGIPVGPIKKEISDWIHSPGGGRGGIAAVTASLPDDGIQLSGSADFDVGTFAGMVNLTPVPEAKGEGGVDSGPDAYSSPGPEPMMVESRIEAGQGAARTCEKIFDDDIKNKQVTRSKYGTASGATGGACWKGINKAECIDLNKKLDACFLNKPCAVGDDDRPNLDLLCPFR